jgi:hypothetical protein
MSGQKRLKPWLMAALSTVVVTVVWLSLANAQDAKDPQNPNEVKPSERTVETTVSPQTQRPVTQAIKVPEKATEKAPEKTTQTQLTKPADKPSDSKSAQNPKLATPPKISNTPLQINPVLLRKVEAPAKVDWSAAMKQARQSPQPLLAKQAPTDPKAAQQRQAAPIQGLMARLPKEQINKTRLPLLMPKAGGMMKIDQAKMVSFGDAYSLNLPQDKGMQLTLMGNRSLIKADKGALMSKARTKVAGVIEDVRITQLEDGWTASFRRFGVVYTVDLLCDDVDSPNCLTDTYIRRAVADLSDVAMGTEALKEAAMSGVR